MKFYGKIIEMWPFKRPKPEQKKLKIVKRVVAGLIIGGAIGSVVGRNMLEKHEEEVGEEEELEED